MIYAIDVDLHIYFKSQHKGYYNWLSILTAQLFYKTPY
jgi:hypothetical protein